MDKELEMFIGIRNVKSKLSLEGEEKVRTIAFWQLPEAQIIELIEVFREAAEKYSKEKVEELSSKEEETCQDSEEPQKKD